MGPNSIEKQFKEKLDNREIKPSEKAWDRLDAMLTVAEKPKRSYDWLYIAAGFIGFVLIATVFFKQTQQMTDKERIETVFDNSKQGPDPASDKVPAVAAPDISTVFKSDNKTAIATSETADKTMQEQRRPSAASQHIKAPQPPIGAVKPVISNQHAFAQNTIINQKSEQSVQKPAYVNVDELLASGEAPENPKLFNSSPGVSVNAAQLLSQIDSELELSFREKVFKTVNKNFQSVKVALANRNNE